RMKKRWTGDDELFIFQRPAREGLIGTSMHRARLPILRGAGKAGERPGGHPACHVRKISREAHPRTCISGLFLPCSARAVDYLPGGFRTDSGAGADEGISGTSSCFTEGGISLACATSR